jgi:tetratricopeptide (TPR) repeat protein
MQYRVGSGYIEVQAYDKAVTVLEKGLAGQPDLAADAAAADATSSLGAVYFAKGEVDKAEAAFERVLAVRPDAAGALLGMGKVRFSKGEPAKALALFEQVVAKHPGTPEAAQAAAFVKELKKGAGTAASEGGKR